MLQLDSAGQKGPEITLEGILIVVEGCFTAERSGSDFCHQWLLSFYTYPANCSTNPPSISSRRETIQTVVLTDWFYSPFQLRMQPPFSLPFSARTNTTQHCEARPPKKTPPPLLPSTDYVFHLVVVHSIDIVLIERLLYLYYIEFRWGSSCAWEFRIW